MADQYEFLEVWRSCLRDHLIQAQHSTAEPPLEVSLSVANPHRKAATHEAFLIRLPIDEQSRRDRKQLQRIREAVELFTILSRVDNGAFTRLLSKAESADAGGHVIYPDWELRIYGTLSPNDPALVQSPVSWGTLLGFHDGPWVNSAEFREASQKLKNMGLEETSQHFHAIDWICQRHRLYITATQKPDTVANAQTFEPLQRMLSIRVPPIVQMCMMPGGTKFELLWKQDIVADTYCLDMDTSYSGSVNFVDITAAVARTAASEISVCLEGYGGDMVDNSMLVPHQSTVNVGF
ncbi:hypothetical protein Pcac1_g16304 [Phytophthora cactorum]|uniref:Uncharacterized protein n=1 Tax=Phytophthora cactorum TaxID=29920 RepID=A0A8T0YLY5_9STRA|nr:hypothetical protein GQ600_9933 [Phytophthora cactorum]KAG2772988.1 hypothetical protein Pcac1_g16304 [Phytophthora cactorum]KAG2811403.1 hypothetical protein PC111_g15257 [Phytophthora cactorum]KAG2814118.1 hypothetical protein PC112_g14443 [Phytophthora cactorum]KAG2834225.1 hypothetical protein PC113_g20430 [Phytophthora cactorum]